MKSSKSSRVPAKSKAKSTARGFSMAEIVKRLSRIHNINPTKGFRNQVATALRRGIDFGILVKSRNKFRFDPEANLRNSMRRGRRRTRSQIRPSRRRAATTRSRTRPGKKTAAPPRRRTSVLQDSTKKSAPTKRTPSSVPRPTVPPPPCFEQKPRHLLTEPFAKAIKHPKIMK